VWRERFLDLVPVAVLQSLAGMDDERSWTLRMRFAERAPKVVMRTFDGSDDKRAWQLRRDYAPHNKEVFGSMIAVDDERAWEIRHQCRDIWPSTVVKSMGPLGLSSPGQAIVEELLARYSDNISLLKHVTRLAGIANGVGAGRPSPKRGSDSGPNEGPDGPDSGSNRDQKEDRRAS